jgi:small subunit ribosomal protein S5
VRADELGLTTPEAIDNFSKKAFPDFTPEEKEYLQQTYSPEQMASIEAGESTIDPQDLAVQGRLRNDPYRMPYIEDFSVIQPVIDRRPKTKPAPNPNAKFMDVEEFTEDLIEWAQKFFPEHGKEAKTLKDFVWEEYKDKPEAEWPEQAMKKAKKGYEEYMKKAEDEGVIDVEKMGPKDLDVLDYLMNRSTMTDQGRGSNSALVPGLPKEIPGVAGLYNRNVDPEDEGLDDEGNYTDLKKQTGMSLRNILQIKTKQLVTRYVSNQTRLGKIQSIHCMYIAGNQNGWLGVGSAKSTEPSIASLKAKLNAIKNMRPIARYENRTTYGNVESKVSGTIVRLNSRPPGMFCPPLLFQEPQSTFLTNYQDSVFASPTASSRWLAWRVLATWLARSPDPAIP